MKKLNVTLLIDEEKLLDEADMDDFAEAFSLEMEQLRDSGICLESWELMQLISLVTRNYSGICMYGVVYGRQPVIHLLFMWQLWQV